MPHLREISITGLFGLYDHDLHLRQDSSVTIVAGPNGIGKTTILRLCTALLRPSYRELTQSEFTKLTVESDASRRIEAEPVAGADEPSGDVQLLLRLRETGRRAKESVIHISPVLSPDAPLPPYIEPYGPETFIDARDGEIIPADQLQFRYGPRYSQSSTKPEPPPWFVPAEWQVDFIETKRLDTLITTGYSAPHEFRPRQTAPINRYLEVVANNLEGARRESARIHQSRTSTVARRLLGEYSEKSVNEDQLRLRYAQVEAHAAALTANGLLSDRLDELPQGNLNPTQKRFFEMFLDDFEAKLEPLDPVSAKIDQLKETVGRKFLNKSLDVGPDGGVAFLAEPYGAAISAEALSSGEQHELALISRLLFAETPGTTVLIDEPELSLHVSWQHEMVGDLLEIASVADITFVLATHSTAIINGRWDIVEDLGALDESGSADGTGDIAG